MGTKPSDEGFLLGGGSTSHCSQFVVRGNRQKLTFDDFYVPTFRLTIRG